MVLAIRCRTVPSPQNRLRVIFLSYLEGSVAELADRLGVGPRHLLRLFLRHTGAPPSEIAATRRVQIAKRLIDQTTMGLSDIAFAAGFRSVRRFNDAFRATYGRPPSSFSRGGAVTPEQSRDKPMRRTQKSAGHQAGWRDMRAEQAPSTLHGLKQRGQRQTLPPAPRL